jgi:hypothetical protein
MIQIHNRTAWAAETYPGWGRDRKLQRTLVFKVGYRFDPSGELSPLPQPPIEETDRYSGDPETSSLIVAADTAPFKKGGEILLSGSAHPSASGQPVLQVQVSLRQRNNQFWKKELRVFGQRAWQRKLLVAVPGQPQAIEGPVPLVYENAYGGTDPANPEKIFAANPAGVGYSFRGLRAKDLGLPQIECGAPFIEGPASRVSPGGFGPLAPHWDPRSKEPVEIDRDAVAKGGCPWAKEPPESLYNTAPPDQRFDQPFGGEMTLSLRGLVADAASDVLINLPEMMPYVQLKEPGSCRDLTVVCDTLIVDTDQMTVSMIFRCALPWLPIKEDNRIITLRDLAAEKETKDEQPEQCV